MTETVPERIGLVSNGLGGWRLWKNKGPSQKSHLKHNPAPWGTDRRDGMTPNDFARKVIRDYGVALDTEADGLVEDLQSAALILAGMIIAMSPETTTHVSGPEYGETP